MVTVEDIEKQVQSNMAIRIAMNRVVKKLKDAEASVGKDVIKGLITGQRTLDKVEYAAMVKQFGLAGVNQIQAMESLNQAQKDYLLKRLDYI